MRVDRQHFAGGGDVMFSPSRFTCRSAGGWPLRQGRISVVNGPLPLMRQNILALLVVAPVGPP